MDTLVFRPTVGSAANREISTRTRLLTAGAYIDYDNADNPALTEAGRAILTALDTVDGLRIGWIQRHSIGYRPYDTHLWTWDEIETAMVQAISQATGQTYDVVRPDQPA